MKLYRVKCQGMTCGLGSKIAYGTAYVVAENSELAYQKVRKYFDEKDIGFVREREMDTVELVADEAEYPECGYRLYL